MLFLFQAKSPRTPVLTRPWLVSTWPRFKPISSISNNYYTPVKFLTEIGPGTVTTANLSKLHQIQLIDGLSILAENALHKSLAAL